MAKTVSRLRELREAAGISQRTLARIIGLDSSNISFWERSGQIPRSDMLVPIARALYVTVEELLGESPPKRVRAPHGRLQRAFESASKLPRRQQEKISEFVEAFVAQYTRNR